jgi:hypothetical protein
MTRATVSLCAALSGLALLATGAVGCGAFSKNDGEKVRMSSGEGVPGARGTVRTQTGEYGNTDLTVEVEHLAPAGQVEDGARTYVVWVKSLEGGQPQNVGSLDVDDNLSARLNTKTAFETFELFITPEARGDATQPSGGRVLETRVESAR